MGENSTDRFDDSQRRVDEHPSEAFGETMDGGGDTTFHAAGAARSNPRAWVGRRIGKYMITELLGVGGMGVVLKGHDASIERDVAIKVLPAELSANPQALNRFPGRGEERW